MFRSRSWFGNAWGRNKNPHSLDRLKYLHNILSRNTTVSENNRGILVESLRCIAEILIWGDQNDSSVFDFFLEKNMLSYFLKIMRQKCGGSSFVCVQLLQTLNILFENIRNETSLYYLLSNNHVNSIIVHKFDFSDEEVMAYYISFLKTLSLKLNNHTIHFFYNEHTKDFPLYTEAIKFFNHPESMVRIAVRTLTLNVYRVQDASMLRFIRDRTAAPYFSNLVWFIGKHILELDTYVRNNPSHQSQQKLEDLVAEHLDHLHYINDILCLDIADLNDVLTEHLLHKLFVPLYIYSLTSQSNQVHIPSTSGREKTQSAEPRSCNIEAIIGRKTMDNVTTKMNYPIQNMESDDGAKPSVSCVVALFLLSQVFLIITHSPIINALAWIILKSDSSIFQNGVANILEMFLVNPKSNVTMEFSKPQLSLEKALESNIRSERDYTTPDGSNSFANDLEQSLSDQDPELVISSVPSTSQTNNTSCVAKSIEGATQLQFNPNNTSLKENSQHFTEVSSKSIDEQTKLNITDEEKQKLLHNTNKTSNESKLMTLEKILERETEDIKKRPFLKTIFESLDCRENDYKALFALCLLYALIKNKGVSTDLLDILLKTKEDPKSQQPQIEESMDESNDKISPSKSAEQSYNTLLFSKLFAIMNLSCELESKVRAVTLEVSVGVAWRVCAGCAGRAAAVDGVRARAAALLRNYYKCDDIFLDMFEDEYMELSKRPLNVEWLCMDAAMLLPPTRTPMSGIAIAKRLPSGEVEKTRRAIRTFFLIRDLYLKLVGKPETQLPLANSGSYNQVGDVLDLNDSDLISCDIIQKDSAWQHRFLAVDNIQVIIVEPDRQRLGWGVAKLVGTLQDLEIQGDKEDHRCLHLTIYKPRGSVAGGASPVLLRAKFKFDDHIRSMAAKQRLTKGRTKARQKKMHQIGRLLEVPGVCGPPASTRHSTLFSRRGLIVPRRSLGCDAEERRGLMVCGGRALSRDSSISRDSSRTSRDSSPQPEEIPLERMRATAGAAPADGADQSQSSPQLQTSSAKSSEETSFMSGENRAKRKGIVETI